MKKTLNLAIFGKLFMTNFLETKRLLLKIAGLRANGKLSDGKKASIQIRERIGHYLQQYAFIAN
jgi:hypothetical protein